MYFIYQVSEDDGLSKIVCTKCFTLLNEWDQFFDMCSKNNMHLKQLSNGDDKVNYRYSK